MPVLVVVPKALQATWSEHLALWGVFSVAQVTDPNPPYISRSPPLTLALRLTQVETTNSLALELAKVRSGRTEVLLVKYSSLQSLEGSHILEDMARIRWSLCVLDEVCAPPLVIRAIMIWSLKT